MRFLFRAVLGAVVFFATILILALAGASYWAYGQYKAPGPLKETTTINIPRGSSVYGISQTLLHHGIVDPAAFTPVNIFVHASGITGQAQTLKAGEYEFTPHISIKEILDKLESGQVVMRQITIREGLTNHEIVQLLNQEKDIEKQNTPQYPEGTLLPETYSYASGDSNADILLRMNLAMEQVLQEAWENRAEGLPLETKEEALVLASIIEKETAIASERRRVAGVFVNRLRVGIALQTDPTVIYALTEGKPQNEGKGPLGRRLLRKDLEIDSPYNTYKYPGLPPTSIANPGKASIEAALNPEEHEYFYFVADGTGGHAFARTLEEHNNNVAKWRKIRRRSK